MFTDGETILVETETGYRWEGEVIDYSPADEQFDEEVLVQVQTHPAYESDGQMSINLDTDIAHAPPHGIKLSVERVWRQA